MEVRSSGLHAMFTLKRKVQLLAAFTVLLILAGVGCSGFFVDPTLTTITVTPPTPSIVENSTQQMTATGSFDDGSVRNITGKVTWTSSNQAVATIDNAGLLRALTAGTAQITATQANITGSTTVTVVLANIVSITVSPTNISLTGQGVTQQYTATGHFSGAPDQDITTTVTWSTNPSSAAQISNTSPNNGLLTTQAVTQPTTVTVTATSGNISGSTQLTVNP